MLLPSNDITPVRIRNDMQVLFANLPHDLTNEEAAKISRIILAQVKDTTDSKGQP